MIDDKIYLDPGSFRRLFEVIHPLKMNRPGSSPRKYLAEFHPIVTKSS
jgi:hypothetical protein